MTISDAPKTPPAHRRAMDHASAAQAAEPAIERELPAVELRLAIGKDGLGLELARPARLACVDVIELAVRLPGARFPIDVSGGVARFRHKRGALERASLEVSARALEAWAAPRLRGLLGPTSPRVWIAVRRGGGTVSIAHAGARVLVFDVAILARGADVRLVVHRARGAGLPRPATALAIGAMEAALGEVAQRSGAELTVRDVGAKLGRALLPDAGARAPGADDVRIGAIGAAEGDAWIVQLARGAAPLEPDEDAARAAETAALARDADEARLAGDWARARALDLAALERAPRHPELARRIAEIDAHVGGRAEAALLTLRETDGAADARSGPRPAGSSARAARLLVGELLAETGDVRGAIAALARAGEDEVAPLLGAHAFARAAELTADPLEALDWLDHAVARAPDAAHVREARAARRLAAGRLEEAVGDVEHLEALAAGPRDKYEVWRRAGDAWKRAGLVAEATKLYERALRYAPDDPGALAGLGAALVAEGRAARGAALLARAVELADKARLPTGATLIDLGRALADALGDRPAAVARVRAVPNDAPEAMLARGLEGRWRAALGDLAGASLAFARLRDLAASLAQDAPDASAAAALLVEGAEFEERAQEDLLAAQRHLACALRLRPRDAAIERAYRAIGARVAGRPEAPTTEGPPGALSAPPAPPAPAYADDANDEPRVQELTRALQANPEDDAVVDELVVRLSRLGRSLELFALLSARLEDAPPERRARLLPRQRAVLERLESDARDAGRDAEASLFADARKALD